MAHTHYVSFELLTNWRDLTQYFIHETKDFSYMQRGRSMNKNGTSCYNKKHLYQASIRKAVPTD